MGMIQFVANYDDLSTDKGYQFKFYCDKCRNGYMSRFVVSKAGLATSVLRTAGNLFGGWMHNAGYGSYELQRLVGGPEHDAALREAMEEGKKYFHQCTRCGRWVCPEVCWNERATLCEDCAPKMEEHVPAAQAEMRVQAAREQIYNKAMQQDYAGGVDLRADAQMQAPEVGVRPGSTPVCRHCGADIDAGAKFCGQCGKPNKPPAAKFCAQCGHQPKGDVKFCPECGGRM
jgi:hypothetical protein